MNKPKIIIKREDTQTEFEMDQEEFETFQKDGFFDRIWAANPRAKITFWEAGANLQL